ncbi:Gfo/Idh/MocA family protein [Marinobacterium jannaschii]|uniref:Gfo/Idh/MocA family protein n=1 Tax=Marinobacterium jannaschii TaxID=64970 RepID=UPI000688D45D|nr:Gfo/Idh/MocA family oxidoreductase [Marinobacterium jannaschii]
MKQATEVRRLLVVGLGSIGKRHLANIRSLMPDAEVAILRRPGSGSTEYEGCRVYHSQQEAVEFNPQAALVCGPASTHLDIAGFLLDNGVHLFIEKPLSHCAEGVSQLRLKAESQNSKVMVGYNLRFLDSLRAFKQLVDESEYGRCIMVKAEVGQYLPDWRPGTDYRTSVSARKSLGGGALLELSHELDYLSWIFGNAVSVQGYRLKVSDLEIDSDDLVMAHMFCAQAGAEIPVSFHLDLLQRQPVRLCKVICERGTLMWDGIEDRVTVDTPEGRELLYKGDGNRNKMYEEELMAFIDCIESNLPEPVSIEEGLQVLQLVDALDRSSATGGVIKL